MRAAVIYESMFGNTREVAEAIAEGLADCTEVSVVPVTSADAHTLDGVDLVVVGGPTHTHGMSRPSTRRMAGKRARKPGNEVELVPGADSGPGVREWFASLGRLEAVGAAFDTRLLGVPVFTGRASKSIRRRLVDHGARMAASPESFLVKGVTGALVKGERERARAWGERLARSDIVQRPGPPDTVHGPSLKE